MSNTLRDIWTEWLLNRRFGGKAENMKLIMDELYPVRDKVLHYAKLGENETLLDVGCGDGLIAFGAFEKSNTVKVIFSDISQDVLNHDQNITQEARLIDRSRFIPASADDLSAITDESVDIVTTRSVLIYVENKKRAFSEFHRVLKSKGRLSIFEPINRFQYPEPENIYSGYDVTPFIDIAKKIKAVYERLQNPATDPVINFDERDLLRFAEQAGFREIHLELNVEIKPHDFDNWDMMLRVAPNPRVPNLEEAMQEVLTTAEQHAFVEYLRPLVEAKRGMTRWAFAYLWAVK
jgi:ubiquinone/menaquinone biosynthesis C-methylase UbiE